MSPSDSNCLKGLSESHLAQPSQPLKWYSYDCLILLSFGVICYVSIDNWSTWSPCPLARWQFRNGHVVQFGPLRHKVESFGNVVFVPKKATEETVLILMLWHLDLTLGSAGTSCYRFGDKLNPKESTPNRWRELGSLRASLSY